MVRRAACSFWFLSNASHFSGSRSSAISSRSSRLSEIVFFLSLIFRRHFHWYKVVNQFYGIQGYPDTAASPPARRVLQRSRRGPGFRASGVSVSAPFELCPGAASFSFPLRFEQLMCFGAFVWFLFVLPFGDIYPAVCSLCFFDPCFGVCH